MAVATTAAAERNSGCVAMFAAYSRISESIFGLIFGRAFPMMASSSGDSSRSGIAEGVWT